MWCAAPPMLDDVPLLLTGRHQRVAQRGAKEQESARSPSPPLWVHAGPQVRGPHSQLSSLGWLPPSHWHGGKASWQLRQVHLQCQAGGGIVSAVPLAQAQHRQLPAAPPAEAWKAKLSETGHRTASSIKLHNNFIFQQATCGTLPCCTPRNPAGLPRDPPGRRQQQQVAQRPARVSLLVTAVRHC